MDRADVETTLPRSDRDVHRRWNNDLEPAVTVASGATVKFRCPDAREGQFTLDTTIEDVKTMDHDRGMPLVGPVAVEGAVPGDVLQVDILEVDHGDVGWTLLYPGERGFGLLPDEFPDWGLHVWDLSAGVGEFVQGIELPLAPFPGTIGLAPRADGDHGTTPPRSVGGNLDTKYLTAGATLYVPVETPSGLFSIGDGHARQGDGEVCGGAIETDIDVTCRFTLQQNRSIPDPQFRPGRRPERPVDPEATFATTGIADDLMAATKRSVSAMVEHLHERRGLSQEEAYILCSVAGDLTINEVVNEPNYVVSLHVREDVFAAA